MGWTLAVLFSVAAWWGIISCTAKIMPKMPHEIVREVQQDDLGCQVACKIAALRIREETGRGAKVLTVRILHQIIEVDGWWYDPTGYILPVPVKAGTTMRGFRVLESEE